MKRVMEEIKVKEKKEKEKPKVETPKGVSFDLQLTQELIEELHKDWDVVDMSKVQDLIERGADVKAKGNEGATPLHVASWNNSVKTAKFLLDAGADLEANADYGTTPLHWASDNDSIETAKLLIEAGADVGAETYDGETPLDLAESDEMEALFKKYMK
jgi:ankyrin repeat protein